MAVAEFYIVILGKKKFEQELATLFWHFALLPEKENRKAFLSYLRAGYPPKDQNLAKLFPILHKRYENGNRLIQGRRLIPSLFGYDDEAKGGRALKRLILALTQEILRFNALVYLEHNQVELARLITKSVSNQVRPKIYKDLLQRLEKSVSGLPEGLDKCMHTWEAAYLGHYSLSAPKEHNDDTSFDQFGQATYDLRAMLELVHKTERINRDAIWGAQAVEWVPSQLADLYTGLVELGLAEYFQADHYETVRRKLLMLAPVLSDVERFSLVAHLVNYLNRQHRKGNASANRRIMEWTVWQLRPGIYPTFRALSKTWFLNQVSNAMALGAFDIAQRVIEVHQNRLDEGERPLAILHGKALIHLGKDEHRLAYNLITRAFHDFRLLPHTDGIRLKSIRLMSALCCFASLPTEWEDQYDLALRDLEVYLGRHESELGSDRWEYYRNMLIIIRKCHNQLVKTGDLEGVHAAVAQQLSRPEPVHARAWLRAFIAHFPPGRAPELPVRPFAQRNQQNGQSP
ncbi:MAG: hypothetical protein AAF597_03410 [Bacteroidota bacterium]